MDSGNQAQVRRLPALALDHDRFEPFGHLPADEGTTHDRADVEFLWNDGRVNYISHTQDEIGLGATGPRCELLNRHDTHTQTLMPVDAAAVMVVAPADCSFADADDLEQVRAFFLNPLDCVHLRRGTWHWGPYPVSGRAVRILNVQGTGYPRDNSVAQLALDHGTVFEVDCDAAGQER